MRLNSSYALLAPVFLLGLLAPASAFAQDCKKELSSTANASRVTSTSPISCRRRS